MLLRIIDKPNQDNNDDLVEIIFQNQDEITRFDSEYYPSPLSSQFKKDLAWYFTDYLYALDDNVTDRHISEKILSLGRYMGDQLLGENHELTKVKEVIEEHGYEHLSVQIESSRFAFFEEQWEMLILPEASFVLSGVCKDFSRLLRMEGIPTHDTELNYELSKEAPLTVLHIVARPNYNDLDLTSSKSYQTFVSLLGSEGAVRYEMFNAHDWASIDKRINNTEKPVHVIHFDGLVELKDGLPNLILESQSKQPVRLPVKQISASMKQHSIGLLCIEAQGYIDGEYGSTIEGGLGLAIVSHVALSQGLANIVGINGVTAPEISNRCFTALYHCIASGLEVGQALVEARKSLQSITKNHDFVNKEKPFQFWSLPVLFRGGMCTFFSAPQPLTPIYQSESYNDLRQRLFGFKDELLPPNASLSSDRELPKVLSELQNSLPIYLGGGEGTGKTSLAHQAGFYLSWIHETKFGFYFDYSTGFYSQDDIIQMIKPILTEAKLALTPSIFIFDNLDVHSTLNTVIEDKTLLLTFIDKLLSQGHKIIASGHTSQCIFNTYSEVNIDKPTTLDVQYHMSLLMAKHNIKEPILDSKLLDIYNKHQGNAFLIEQTIPLLVSISQADLASEMVSTLPLDSAEKCVESFFKWQWQKMPAGWQRLYMILVDIPGVLLEMIDVVANQKVDNNPVNVLISLISKEDIFFSDALAHFSKIGFLQQYSHGHVISSRFINFTKALRDDDSEFQNVKDKFPVLTSKILCTAIAILVPHLQSQPESPIKKNLLVNRGKWAKHLETLWHAEIFEVFLKTKGALFTLLKQEGLAKECAEWSYELIRKTEAVLPTEAGAPLPLKQLVWLNVATEALEKSETETKSLFDISAEVWMDWLNNNYTNENLPLIIPASQFLESYHLKQENWCSCISVNERILLTYKEKGVWPKYIQAAKVLAFSHFKLGENEIGLNYENEILTLPPFDKFIPGYKEQLVLEIVSSRITHNLIEEAQGLLTGLEASNQNESIKLAIANVQTDIYLKKDQYREAIPLLEMMHATYERQGHKEAVEAIKKQLHNVHEKLKATGS